MKRKVKQSMMAVIISASVLMGMSGCGNGSDAETNEMEAATETEAITETEATEEAEVPEETAPDTEVAEEQGSASTEGTELTAGTYPDGTSPQFSDTRLRLTIDGQEVIIRMYENTAVDAFLERLPLENLSFSDLSGIEKPAQHQGEEFSLADETPGYDPVTGDMVIYRPWGNFTIFYGDFRHSDELVPLGQVESGLDILSGQTEDFTGTMEMIEE